MSSFYVQTASGLHLRGLTGKCRNPVAVDPENETLFEFCNHPFFEHEGQRAIDYHVSRCSREHHEMIVRYLRTRRPEVMQAWDKDLERWVSRHRDELVEGRKKLGGGVT